MIEVVEPLQVDVLKASLLATSLHFPAIVSIYTDDLGEFNVLPGQRALTLGVAKTASHTVSYYKMLIQYMHIIVK